MGGHRPMRNKLVETVERFQAVINDLKEEFEFIHLGSTAEPALQGVNDLRGATNLGRDS